MSDRPIRRWLITGVSSGLGRAVAEHALAQGDIVVGTLRQSAQMAEFETLAPGRAFALQLDVTDDAAVEAGVATAIETAGGLDILVNNAGYALMGPTEDISVEEARRQIETNVMGVVKTTLAVLPYFRAHGGGRIVNIGSVASVIGFPTNAFYSASKHAVAGFSEGVAKEVGRFGIKVTVVEPGGFRTKFGASSLVLPAKVSPHNVELVETIRSRLQTFAGNATNDPARGAAVIGALVEMDEPPIHLPLGADGFKMIGDALKARQDEYAKFEAFGSDTAYPA
jgi:NAD(P)-dependent dehydrogenase (short-subunit alcohol dehydrogenase family)